MIALLALTLLALVAAALALVPSRLPRVRVVVVLALPLSIIFVWLAVRSYQGWPTSTRPPIGAVFVGASVREPDAIYLLLAPKGSDRPRLYKQPYSDELYRQVLLAQRAVRRGEATSIQRPARRAGQRRQGGGGNVPPFALRRYELPPARPPRKTG